MAQEHMTRIIKRREEECECEWCGAPLEIGDRSFEIVDANDPEWPLYIFCSGYCRERSEKHHHIHKRSA